MDYMVVENVRLVPALSQCCSQPQVIANALHIMYTVKQRFHMCGFCFVEQIQQYLACDCSCHLLFCAPYHFRQRPPRSSQAYHSLLLRSCYSKYRPGV